MVAFNTHALPDSVFLGINNGGGLADLLDDLGQDHVDLTNAGGYLTEANSSRAALAGNREVLVVARLNDTDAGTLVAHGLANPNVTFRVWVVNGGRVLFHQASTTNLLQIDLPDVDGTDQEYVISWCCRERTGGGLRSEAWVCNKDTGNVAVAFANHAAPTTSATWTLSVGARNAGSDLFTDVSRILAVRIGARFHSQVEQFEGFVTTTAAPSLDTETRAELLPVSNATGIGEAGAFYGPAVVHAHAQLMEAERRLYSPLVSISFRYPASASDGRLTAAYTPTPWTMLAPGSEELRITLKFLFLSPVPPECRRARVRVQVVQFATEPDIGAVKLAVYSMNRAPASDLPGDLVYYHTTIVTRQVDDGLVGLAGENAIGSWLDLGELKLAVDDLGRTWLTLGYYFDTSEGFESSTGLRIRAITVEPLVPESDEDAELI